MDAIDFVEVQALVSGYLQETYFIEGQIVKKGDLLAVILIVPMCLLCAIFGVWFRGMDNNILTQIGFIVLVGLACKNAILIVEFAKAEEDAGKNRFDAAVEACRLRLRPIMMTAFSFILGVIPLLIATGAGAEMRQALGTAVFSGMLGVTIFGLFLTPVFYVVLRKFSKSTIEQESDDSQTKKLEKSDPKSESGVKAVVVETKSDESTSDDKEKSDSKDGEKSE